MREGCNGACLPLESCDSFRIVTPIARQDLDGYRAVETRVVRAGIIPHPAS